MALLRYGTLVNGVVAHPHTWCPNTEKSLGGLPLTRRHFGEN